jgi:CSLREA domain-containing protein
MLPAARSSMTAPPALGVAMKVLQCNARRHRPASAYRRAWLACAAIVALAGPTGLVAATINVNTLADTLGGFPNSCSLREAIKSANDNADFDGCAHTGAYGSDTINLPAGQYFIQRDDAAGDEDANTTGDFDILSPITIIGAGSQTTSIIGDKAGVNDYTGRIIEVAAGSLDLRDVTVQGGVLTNQNAGAGIRSEPGTTTTLTRVRVQLNSAGGNAGGILNRAMMTLNSSSVSGNETLNATQGGAGIFNDDNAVLTINDSQINQNTTSGNGANGNGAGIFNDVGAKLTLDNSTVDSNIIAIDGVLGTNVDGDGGGIYNLGKLTLVRSTISHNVSAGNFSKGGGIFCHPSVFTVTLIDRSLIFANEARRNPDNDIDQPIPERATGGGMRAEATCVLTVTDSIFSGNSAEGGAGGLSIDNANVRIERSLFVDNHADDGSGGGINSGALTLSIVNSTILNNTASSAGGGIQVSDLSGTGASIADISSSTIVGNTSNISGIIQESHEGGGINSNGTFLVFLRNTVVAGNLADRQAVGDDCFGDINLRGNNLIQNSANCTLLDKTNTDIVDTNALLATATNNGGLIVGASNGQSAGMLTREPLSNSPLLDAGNANGCKDENDVLLPTDQIGQSRAIDGPDGDSQLRCDIGAIEFDPMDMIFIDGFE